ncbi:MAG: hypothetical protein AB7O78_06235 [Thermoleophilia bacterium]
MSRLTRSPVPGAAVLLAAAALAGSAAAAPGDTELVSRKTDGSPANGASDAPAISGNGRFVFFHSLATNLPSNSDEKSHGYLRDLTAGSTILIGRPLMGALTTDGAFIGSLNEQFGVTDRVGRTALPTLTEAFAATIGFGANGRQPARIRPSISADGSRLAFARAAATDEGPLGVFVKSFADGSLTLVSRKSGPGGTPASDVFSSAISGNGRYVAFESDTTDLAPGDSAGTSDIWLRDLQTDETTLISRGSGAAGVAGDRDSFEPSISDDGRYVAFSSYAKTFAPDDTDDLPSVYVRDRIAGTTTLVSRATGAPGAPANNDAFEADISGDGRFVAFTSAASNLGADGGNGTRDVFVRDLANGTTTLVSRGQGVAGPPAQGTSEAPVISDDGRYVAFESDAPLVAGAFAGVNIYRRDLGEPPPVAGGGGVGGGGAGVGGGGATGPQRKVRCAGLLATKVGTARRDVIRGTRKRDVIAALGGNDTVLGLGGDDVVCLGDGDDTADGGAGADRIIGGPGADRLAGGAGRDLLDGGAGADVLRGGAGIDRLLGGAGADALIGGAARDALVGGAGRNRLTQ